MTTDCWVDVAVQTPAHSAVGGLLTYRCVQPVQAGHLVRVPLGRKQLLGVVWSVNKQPPQALKADAVRDVLEVLDAVAPLSTSWRQLVEFGARYYQRAIGEVALTALPPALRALDRTALARRLRRHAADATPGPLQALAGPALTPEQAQVLQALGQHSGVHLLFGNTGSGKTEVYLRAVADRLAADPLAQALVMVPEINLTPQLEARVRERFGHEAVVSMHSGLTPAQRLRCWLAAHAGQARIVLGTRMAVFASLPRLRLIVVDEEHDPSYKQQEGARYSARDLAVYRGRLDGALVLLGSATPSLESWYLSRPASEGGRYHRLHMPSRIGAARLPTVRRVDMNHQPRRTLLSAPVLQALQERVSRGEQSMLLLNRRGYAPVLHCGDCGWKSECRHCSAFRVFHKTDRTLRCHHCGATERVPQVCPSCGNADIAPLGRGTEQLEEHLGELLAGVRRADGTGVRIARIDADTTRLKGSLETQLAQVHAGEVDVLVGTQMIAKGHDFRRVTLVVAVNPDTALFSSDFRAAERLFALLMQAAGRAGRDAALAHPSEMLVQTFHPSHPLFEALKRHDYPSFAQHALSERALAQLPPLMHQALLRADARSQEVAQAFLREVQACLNVTDDSEGSSVQIYPPVPMSLQRVANVERAQMLLESTSRSALQQMLAGAQTHMLALRQQPAHRGIVRWLVDVDPQTI